MDIISKRIGAAARSARINAGFTQRDIAALTGYTYQNISAFELGRADNMRLLIWYVNYAGLRPETIKICKEDIKP